MYLNMNHRVKVGLALAVVLVGTMGASNSCGTSNGVVNKPSASTPGSSSGGSSSPTTAAATAAHVGSALAVKDQQGNPALITLVKLIDPATGANEASTPDAGKRFVGADFTIKNTGSASLTGDINVAAVIGSDGQTYQADFSDIAGCTNFNSGQYTLAPAASGTGCATFQVPTGIKVAKVQYSPSSGFGGNTGEWLVP